MSICLSGAAIVACGSPGTSLEGMAPSGGTTPAGTVTVIMSGADGGTLPTTTPAASGDAGAVVVVDAGSDGGGNGDGGGGGGDAGASAFHQGDAFDYALVTPSSQMVSAMLDVLAYPASAGPKAVAVNAQGLGFVRTQGDSQATVSQAALEACFVIGGGSPCTLLATGNTFAVDASALSSSSSFTFSLAAPTDVSKVPFVQPSVVTATTSGYGAVSGAKAIAISLDGVIVAVPGSATDIVSSAAEAQRLALERCELTAGLAPCTLFAVGANVVFGPTKPNGAPQIDYARTTLQTNLPGVSDAAFTANVVPYMQGIASGSTGAIFLDDFGDFGTGWSMVAGQGATTAQTGCNQAAGAGTCFAYATNDTITFTPSDLSAIKIYSLETHCKAMPRTDCAAHQAISYYTTRTGSVALETCTF
jgi:hypothetical protein